MNKIWKLWCKSLGEKASDDSVEADIVGLFRTVIVLLNVITCFVIMSSVLRHW